MSLMGVKIPQFDVPVCNSFKAKVLNGRLCYEVDMKDLSRKANFNDLKKGLVFVLDYNKDRQISNEDKETQNKIQSNIVDLTAKGSK